MSKYSSLSFSKDELHWLYLRGMRSGNRFNTSEGWALLKVWDVAFFAVRGVFGFSWKDFARMARGSGKRKKRKAHKQISLP
jgi:hypothetical protein